METRRIGQLEVSIVGLGCNNFGMRCDEDQTRAVVYAALDAGITCFDTADVYGGSGGSEELLGKALGARRSDIVLATKFGAPMGTDPEHSGASPRWIAKAIDGSLRRLATDWIDLYQLHVPDPSTPLEETLEALDALVRAGKVREIGVSNVGSTFLDDVTGIVDKQGWARPTSVQNQWNLLERKVEEKVVPACARLGITVLPYFPLASGLLTGKYRRGEAPPAGTRLAALPAERVDAALTDRNFDVVEALADLAKRHERTLLELAIGFLAAQPVTASVIAGATRADQLLANVEAVSRPLEADELAEIDELTKPATRAPE